MLSNVCPHLILRTEKTEQDNQSWEGQVATADTLNGFLCDFITIIFYQHWALIFSGLHIEIEIFALI